MTEFENADEEHLQHARDEERAERDADIDQRLDRDQKLTEVLTDGADGTPPGSA